MRQTTPEFSENEVRAMLSEEALHHRAAGGWSAVEVVGHLADHDAFERSRRFEAILAEVNPALPDDHTRLWVEKENYQALSAADALAWFRRERDLVVALLERLGPRERTLLQLADLRGHDREHLAQARTATQRRIPRPNWRTRQHRTRRT